MLGPVGSPFSVKGLEEDNAAFHCTGSFAIDCRAHGYQPLPQMAAGLLFPRKFVLGIRGLLNLFGAAGRPGMDGRGVCGGSYWNAAQAASE